MSKHDIKRHIILVGFSGSGKSTLGPVLAKRLKLAFIDTDSMVVARIGKPIAEIFRTRGEAYFRTLERQAVIKACQSVDPAVIALGGGALLDKRNEHTAHCVGTVIYLRCSMRELISRLKRTSDRPLLRGDAAPFEMRIAELLRQRKPGYLRADLTVSVSTDSKEAIVSKIIKQLKRYHVTH